MSGRPETRTPGGNRANAEDTTNTNAAIVADLAGQRKAGADKVRATLQAEGALQGYEVIFLPDGRCLACHWGWCKVLRNVRELARFLGKGWIV
jgi:mono/diheme cytochrome c family protein